MLYSFLDCDWVSVNNVLLSRGDNLLTWRLRIVLTRLKQYYEENPSINSGKNTKGEMKEKAGERNKGKSWTQKYCLKVIKWTEKYSIEGCPESPMRELYSSRGWVLPREFDNILGRRISHKIAWCPKCFGTIKSVSQFLGYSPPIENRGVFWYPPKSFLPFSSVYHN